MPERLLSSSPANKPHSNSPLVPWRLGGGYLQMHVSHAASRRLKYHVRDCHCNEAARRQDRSDREQATSPHTVNAGVRQVLLHLGIPQKASNRSRLNFVVM